MLRSGQQGRQRRAERQRDRIITHLTELLGRVPTADDLMEYYRSKSDHAHPSNYEIDDDFQEGNAGFEIMVSKIGLFPNLVRKILRENWRLERKVEELEAEIAESKKC